MHLVRNSLRYASKKHWGQIKKQLKAIYTAPGLDSAEKAFDVFADDWEDTYPAMVKSWRDTWEDFIPFLEFPIDLRKIVYSTNATESLNARFRKAAVKANAERQVAQELDREKWYDHYQLRVAKVERDYGSET